MTTTFNAAATKTVGVNATNFEFTFTRLERITFGPGKITALGAELERMGATRALVATGKTLGAARDRGVLDDDLRHRGACGARLDPGSAF
jgi:hypothetical protein